ncbi:hypothetical protein HYE67_010061 [Fusarium culmorum]|uniref:HNH nuclease domain-containing protein n=1 Tax=Fusarium culmorum TaxID=5516 RepID=A0A7S8DGC8_FUSCU|nr:hypothetical protein HYE67_010061 [Fusarium culmorum]
MNPSSQNMTHPHFSEPEPFFSLTDFELRRTYAQRTEAHIRTLFHDFRLRTEYVAAIILNDNVYIDDYLSLDPKSYGWRNNPALLQRTLLSNDAFCKHYMLHLDSENFQDPAWILSLPERLDSHPDAVVDDETLKAEIRALDYYSHFETDPHLQDYPYDEDEETKCRKRDGEVCAVTGRANPDVFWFFPPTLNATVEQNDITGNLAWSGSFFMGSIFAAKHKSNPFCDEHKLGGSHKAWNMLCIDPILYDYLTTGFCTFKYHGDTKLENGDVEVALQFYWLPQPKARFGQVFDMKKDWQGLMDDLQEHQDKGFPPPAFWNDDCTTKSGEPLRSGHLIYVIVSEQHVEYFKSAIQVHWACSVFTSLCGASGRPYLLSGKEYEDRTMQRFQDLGRQGKEGDSPYSQLE